LHPVCYDTVCFALLRVVSCYQEKFIKQPVLDIIDKHCRHCVTTSMHGYIHTNKTPEEVLTVIKLHWKEI